MSNHSHRIRWQTCVVVGLAVSVWTSLAHARTESLAWTYPAPDLIDGFEVLWGTSSGNYSNTIDVGMASTSGGTYVHQLSVPDLATVYVVVRAYDSAGSRSLNSNQRVRAPAETSEPPAPRTGSLPESGFLLDFTGSSLGNRVAGWVDTIAGNRMATDDSLFKTTELNGKRVLTTSSIEPNIHSHYVYDNSDGWSGYELRGAMLATDASGGIGVTAHSQYPDRDAYYRLRQYEGRAFHLSPHGTTASCAQQGTGVTAQAGIWYRFSLRVDSSSSNTRVRAKVWKDGAKEPSSWQADCTDSTPSRLDSGTIGVWSIGGGEKYWDVLEVSGDGTGSSGSTSEPLQAPTLIDVRPIDS